jgi:hypothetical protein
MKVQDNFLSCGWLHKIITGGCHSNRRKKRKPEKSKEEEKSAKSIKMRFTCKEACTSL